MQFYKRELFTKVLLPTSVFSLVAVEACQVINRGPQPTPVLPVLRQPPHPDRPTTLGNERLTSQGLQDGNFTFQLRPGVLSYSPNDLNTWDFGDREQWILFRWKSIRLNTFRLGLILNPKGLINPYDAIENEPTKPVSINSHASPVVYVSWQSNRFTGISVDQNPVDFVRVKDLSDFLSRP